MGDELIEKMAEAMREAEDTPFAPYEALARAALDALKSAGWEVVKPELGKLSADWLASAQRYPEATRKFATDLINAANTADVKHFMLPGSHERPAGAECWCGAEWDRWNDRCCASAARAAEATQ